MTLKADVAALISESVRKAKSSLPNFAVARKLGLDDAERLGLAGVDSMFARLSPPTVELFDTIWGLISVPLTSQESTVDDKALIAAIAAAVEPEHRKLMGASGGVALAPFAGALSQILAWLRANQVKWLAILAQLPAIIAIVTGPGSWTDKVQALIQLFFPTGAPSVPAPQFP